MEFFFISLEFLKKKTCFRLYIYYAIQYTYTYLSTGFILNTTTQLSLKKIITENLKYTPSQNNKYFFKTSIDFINRL